MLNLIVMLKPPGFVLVPVTHRIFKLLARLLKLRAKLKPLGFVLATRLHRLVSKTASDVFECLRLRLAPNPLMSLLQELLSEKQLLIEFY